MHEKSLRIEHVLELISWKKAFCYFRKINWSYRVTDFYRAEALKIIFSELKGKLLDFGCGSKPYLAALKTDQITDWVGADLKSRTTGHGSENAADLFLENGKIPCKNGMFDLVLSTQVLEHVDLWEEAILEFHRVLKTGGLGIVTIPMSSILHEIPYDFHRFTPYGFQKSIERNGFRLVRAVALGGVITFLGTIFCNHINFIMKLPLLGKVIHAFCVLLATSTSLYLEVLAFSLGYKRSTITSDYLFLIRKI